MTKKQKIELWIKASESANIEIPSDEVLADEIGCSVSHVNHVRNTINNPQGMWARRKPSINSQPKKL